MRKDPKSISIVGVVSVCLVFLLTWQGNSQDVPADELEKAMEYVDREDFGSAVEVLEDVLLTFREKAPLQIRNAVLVTHIYRFGSYDERKHSVFARSEPIVIYLELRNFTFEGGCASVVHRRRTLN